MTTTTLEPRQKQARWQATVSASRNGRRGKNSLLLFQDNLREKLPSNFSPCNKGLDLLRMIFLIRAAQSVRGSLVNSNPAKVQAERDRLLAALASAVTRGTVGVAVVSTALRTQPAAATGCHPGSGDLASQSALSNLCSECCRYPAPTAGIFPKYLWRTLPRPAKNKRQDSCLSSLSPSSPFAFPVAFSHSSPPAQTKPVLHGKCHCEGTEAVEKPSQLTTVWL